MQDQLDASSGINAMVRWNAAVGPSVRIVALLFTLCWWKFIGKRHCRSSVRFVSVSATVISNHILDLPVHLPHAVYHLTPPPAEHLLPTKCPCQPPLGGCSQKQLAHLRPRHASRHGPPSPLSHFQVSDLMVPS
eukprot:GGOE01034822.1.p1 GENE.GGOE01034822.1~~GGOE01034822.1.p1  ORF type:complete len:134 (+),score=2.82 GGOE01034822.1:795-1196(+)